MSNGGNIFQELRQMAEGDKISPEAYRRLMLGAMADIYKKQEELSKEQVALANLKDLAEDALDMATEAIKEAKEAKVSAGWILAITTAISGTVAGLVAFFTGK